MSWLKSFSYGHGRARCGVVLLAAGLALMGMGQSSFGSNPSGKASAAASDSELEWLTDYTEATARAKEEGKLLLVYFAAERAGSQQKLFEQRSLADPQVVACLKSQYVAARIPLDAEITIDGKPTQLIQHPAFGELAGHAGTAIIDYKHTGTEHYGYVVNLLPLRNGRYYRFDPCHLAVMLDLPAGTLTQRTMVFAVRIHPENPASTVGEPDPVLMSEARQHSRHQAQINVQGHHQWEHRYQRISGRLPGGLRAQEVVAESWPGQGLLDACVDCVASWRHSAGHWGAVRARQPRFGYDIRRGSNGVWYATGLFGNRR